MESSQHEPDAHYLQRLLVNREHSAFLSEFESDRVQTQVKANDYLQALGGEGLCLLFQATEKPSRNLAKRYAALLLKQIIVAPADIVERLSDLLRSAPLAELASQIEKAKAVSHEPVAPDQSFKANSGKTRQTILHVRRVVQIMQMVIGDGQFSDASGICRSIFRSPQERTFLRVR